MMQNNKPIHEIRLGAIRAAIWKNETAHGPRLSASFSRLYKEDKEWKSTTSFGRDDLLLLAKVANEVHSFMHSSSAPAPEE
ncbi:MAG: hypothetical protein JNN07_27005 [Verrucomicrobiales bacterium]|nr:hypothetical protein [Verrucomicrobiales bacterium]